jgi:hypothetical protein
MLLYVAWLAIWQAMFDPQLWTESAACRARSPDSRRMQCVKSEDRI